MDVRRVPNGHELEQLTIYVRAASELALLLGALEFIAVGDK